MTWVESLQTAIDYMKEHLLEGAVSEAIKSLALALSALSGSQPPLYPPFVGDVRFAELIFQHLFLKGYPQEIDHDPFQRH